MKRLQSINLDNCNKATWKAIKDEINANDLTVDHAKKVSRGIAHLLGWLIHCTEAFRHEQEPQPEQTA